MDLVVPECKNLSLEGIRNILFGMNEKLEEVMRRQNDFGAEVKRQVESRPTLDQVLRTVNGSEESKIQFTIGLRDIQGLLKNFEESMAMNLKFVQSASDKYEFTMKKIIEKAQTSLELSHIKYQKAQECSKKNLKFTLNHIYQLHLKNKKRRIIENWKQMTQNKKLAAKMMIQLSKSFTKNSKQKSLKRWERNSTRILIKSLKFQSNLNTKALESHTKDINSLKSR